MKIKSRKISLKSDQNLLLDIVKWIYKITISGQRLICRLYLSPLCSSSDPQNPSFQILLSRPFDSPRQQLLELRGAIDRLLDPVSFGELFLPAPTSNLRQIFSYRFMSSQTPISCNRIELSLKVLNFPQRSSQVRNPHSQFLLRTLNLGHLLIQNPNRLIENPLLQCSSRAFQRYQKCPERTTGRQSNTLRKFGNFIGNFFPKSGNFFPKFGNFFPKSDPEVRELFPEDREFFPWSPVPKSGNFFPKSGPEVRSRNLVPIFEPLSFPHTESKSSDWKSNFV